MTSDENKPTDPHAAPAEQPASGGCCGGFFTTNDPTGNRRDFMLMIGAGMNVIAGAMMAVPILGYILSNFTSRSPQKWLSLGTLETFPEGSTRIASYTNPGSKEWDGQMSQIPCWVRRKEGQEFQVFAINCTHLGCPVRWFEESKLFMCPCHGGAYYEDGRQAAGPPPRPLYEYKYRIVDGELQVLAGQMPTLSQPI